jgi:hypothetical protein
LCERFNELRGRRIFCVISPSNGISLTLLLSKIRDCMVFTGENIPRRLDVPAPRQLDLVPGKVYRTRDLGRWTANPTRLAKRLVRLGVLEQLAHGLFVHPRRGRFGAVPPKAREVLEAFLDGAPFVLTGSDHWNALGLGATAVFAQSLVYNTKRSGEFVLGSQSYLLRRVRFPERPSAEWFVIDLLEHAEMAGVSRRDVEVGLVQALARGRFDASTLRANAREYGSKETLGLVSRALEAAKLQT